VIFINQEIVDNFHNKTNYILVENEPMN